MKSLMTIYQIYQKGEVKHLVAGGVNEASID